MNKERALRAINGQYSDVIPHWESFHNPAYIETYLGIDPYREPLKAAQELLRTHPIDVAVVGYGNSTISSTEEKDGMILDEQGKKLPRWGTGVTERWEWGIGFASIEDVLAYEPLSEMNFVGKGFVADYDFSLSAEELGKVFQSQIDTQRNLFGDTALELAGFYNTLFMWPMLTFGWENLLLLCGGYPAEMKRLLAGFAHRSRRVFEAIALTDTPLVWSHDDICCTRGPVVSPQWLREFVYPYYEEFWSIVRSTGKKVIFISDGDITTIASDIFSLGADGILSEPHTNWEELAKNHPEKILLGQGDCRVLATNDPSRIRAMVRHMAKTACNCPGYFMHIGNLITHTLTPQSIRIYFEAAAEYCKRTSVI